jgi:hypothetical protein
MRRGAVCFISFPGERLEEAGEEDAATWLPVRWVFLKFLSYRGAADWKSAIQQIGNPRYEGGSLSFLVSGRSLSLARKPAT